MSSKQKKGKPSRKPKVLSFFFFTSWLVPRIYSFLLVLPFVLKCYCLFFLRFLICSWLFMPGHISFCVFLSVNITSCILMSVHVCMHIFLPVHICLCMFISAHVCSCPLFIYFIVCCCIFQTSLTYLMSVVARQENFILVKS